jgi:hypothetical protein
MPKQIFYFPPMNNDRIVLTIPENIPNLQPGTYNIIQKYKLDIPLIIKIKKNS